MSSVRMCDRCGTIFSEKADDWSTFGGTRTKKDERGERVTIQETMDACPECTEMITAPRRPMELPTMSPAGGTTVSPHYEDEGVDRH
jgi:uncharacterized protein YbbK (DUF523 family)